MPLRFSFALKVAVAVVIAVYANWLFLFHEPGATWGYFALALIAGVAIARPAVWRDRKGLAGLIAAAGFALVLIEAPSPLAFLLWWSALVFASLAPRIARLDGAWRWFVRMTLGMAAMPIAPLIDWGRRRKVRGRGRGPRFALLPLIALPVLGTIVFAGLFASANPLIAGVIDDVAGMFEIDPSTPFRAIFFGVIFTIAWGLLRPFAFMPMSPSRDAGAPLVIPGVSMASVTLSLIVFNLLFAVQNLLDILFLWSGAPLPGQTTMADYAHQGAYPLIATALLAGLFVIVTLRPGSETARSPLIRGLVTLWVGQNLLLVASSMLRTFDYIDAYSLTRLRIAALIWMVLVAVGLVLVCVRMWRGKSDGWLLSANAVTGLLVLAGCTTFDLGRMAAAWNVRHAKEAGGKGVNLDLCYLNGLGSSALLPITELEGRTNNAGLKERLAWSRNRIMDRMERELTDWHSWTWRDERRFLKAERMIGEKGLKRRHAGPRRCDGTSFPPPPPPPPAPPEPKAALTSEPGR